MYWPCPTIPLTAHHSTPQHTTADHSRPRCITLRNILDSHDPAIQQTIEGLSKTPRWLDGIAIVFSRCRVSFIPNMSLSRNIFLFFFLSVASWSSCMTLLFCFLQGEIQSPILCIGRFLTLNWRTTFMCKSLKYVSAHHVRNHHYRLDHPWYQVSNVVRQDRIRCHECRWRLFRGILHPRDWL